MLRGKYFIKKNDKTNSRIKHTLRDSPSTAGMWPFIYVFIFKAYFPRKKIPYNNFTIFPKT